MRILLIEDDEDHRMLLEHRVRSVMPAAAIQLAETCADARAILQSSERPELVIVDWQLPDGEGVDLIREVRARERDETDHVYFLMHTSRTGEEALDVALRAGADDFLSKPAGTAEMRARLGSGIRIANVLARLREERDISIGHAYTDALTSLGNRRAALHRIEEWLEAHRREGTSFTAGMLDLDGLKRVNDADGHAAGDALIASAAYALRGALGPEEWVARLAGDEFLVLSAAADEASRSGLSARIAEGLEVERVAASFGLVAVDPSDEAIGVSEVLAAADDAMYRTKRGSAA